ncbi:hypothetical protein F441_20610, partial [Phytophthora nicotianae CJ01A1]
MARIRPGRRKKADAVAAVARSIDFGHFWRQLRAVGWTYKRPTGIETKGRYVSADGSEVLVGEEAVVAYALDTGLLDEQAQVSEGSDDEEPVADTEPDGDEDLSATATTKKKPAVSTKKTAAATKKYTNVTEKPTAATKKTTASNETADSLERTSSTTNATRASPQNFVEDMSGAIEDVRASQIDTSAELSQRTMNQLFGTPSSDSSSDIELSQSAVARAFDLTNLQLLSEVSGAESDTQADTVANDEQDSAPADHPGTDTRRGGVPATPPTRVLRPRRDVKKDVNFIPEDEALSEYESFSSGESDDDIEDDNDEDDFYGREDSEENDDLSEDDAVPMDAAFIESLQVGCNALNKQASQQREDALRAMEWTTVSHGFEEDARAYPGLDMEDAQPVAELREMSYSPLRTFFYFMPKTLWVKIAAETNRYGLQE